MLSARLLVGLRYLASNLGTILGLLAIVGWLTPDQAKVIGAELPKAIEALIALAGAVTAIGIPLWAMFKGAPIKAVKVIEEIKASVPARVPVTIKTPAGQPDITVQAR